MSFKRTTPAFQRCKDQRSYGRDRVGARRYEDVEAVAADVIKRGIAKPEKLAVIGGSNGGLMVGNMLVRPVASKLFGAAVCQVPLLDMKRYRPRRPRLVGSSSRRRCGRDADRP